MIRTILLFFVMGFCSLTAFGQVFVNDVDINKTKVKYVQIVARANLAGRVVVLVDFGQAPEWKNPKIRDRDGKTMKFESVIGALNFMENNGWEFVDTYALTVGNNNVYHFLLRRRGSKE